MFYSLLAALAAIGFFASLACNGLPFFRNLDDVFFHGMGGVHGAGPLETKARRTDSTLSDGQQ